MPANSRQLIIDAAAEVFSRCGYHLSSMDAIAESAGVAKGTLYYHFPGKSALLRSVIIEGLEMLTQETRSCIQSAQDFDSSLRRIIHSHMKIYTDFQDLATLVFNESITGLDQQYFEQIRAAKQSHLSMLASLFDLGCQQGVCRKIDFDLASQCFITLIDCTCRYYLKKPDELTAGQMEETLYQFISSGLLI